TFLTTLTFLLPYCGSHKVDHFLCDIFWVVKLACDNTIFIETVSFPNTGLVPMTCFLAVLASYICIVIAILKVRSAEERCKAAPTYISHLSVVTLFFGPCSLIYTQPSLSEMLVTPVQIFGNVVITPILNSTIYTLRSKEVKGTLKKLAGAQVASEGHYV
ncbi:OL149 protein, partial [Crocuta crocuta]